MTTVFTMKVSSNGQVSIPAAVRRRWAADRVVMVDLGNRVVLRPVSDDSRSTLVGKYQGLGPNSTAMRVQDRADDAAVESV